MKKNVFFDVETNNLRNDRICQIAMIYEEDGKEVFSKSWYVNPESKFAEKTMSFNGITPQMVKDAPTFPAVWEEIKQYFESSLVVGHNVIFDIRVLDKVLQFYNIDFPAVTYCDTYRKAGKILPNSNGCGLSSLCEFYNIALDKHHDALSDTRACRDLYHIFERTAGWNIEDESTYWFGTAELKADSRLLENALNELAGILFAIASDGTIDSIELTPLEDWSDKYADQRNYPGFTEMYTVLDQIFETGKVTKENRFDIYKLLYTCESSSTKRTAAELHALKGMVKGFLADDKVSESEIQCLKVWMNKNIDLKGIYPFDSIFAIVESMMMDGVLSDDEKAKLKRILTKFIDPLSYNDAPENVSVEGKTCCLSGTFAYGSKAEVTKKITELGGSVINSVNKKTEILIVGGYGSSSWAYGNYGEKVKKALKMQENGHPIIILGETEVL